jgi:hypothetical protein
MARASRRAKQPNPSEQVDQAEDVAEETTEAESTEVSVERATWKFDHEQADALYEDAKKKATAFARVEHNLPQALREFGKSIRKFVVSVMPDNEIDVLRQRLASYGVVNGKDVLPQEVVDYLTDKQVRLPHFNSVNPVQGIVASLYQPARLSLGYIKPAEAQHLIDVAERPVSAEDLLGDSEEARKLTAAQQTQLSKLARWVLASIEMPEDEAKKTGGERLFGKSYDNAISEWTEWRDKNPQKLISTTKPKLIRKTKAEKEAEERRREEQAEARRMQETMAASGGLSLPPPDAVLGGDVDTSDTSATPSATGATTIDGTATEVMAEPARDAAPSKQVTQPAEPEPRFHAFAETIPSMLPDDVMESLPRHGKLVFIRRTYEEDGDTGINFVGWEG